VICGRSEAATPTRNYRTQTQHAEHSRPYRIQHLLSQAGMDEESLVAALRGYLTGHLGTDEVVLVVDETGDLKKGAHTVGVARQSPPAATRPGGIPPGTTGQIENCQVAVYLAYTTPDA